MWFHVAVWWSFTNCCTPAYCRAASFTLGFRKLDPEQDRRRYDAHIPRTICGWYKLSKHGLMTYDTCVADTKSIYVAQYDDKQMWCWFCVQRADVLRSKRLLVCSANRHHPHNVGLSINHYHLRSNTHDDSWSHRMILCFSFSLNFLYNRVRSAKHSLTGA